MKPDVARRLIVVLLSLACTGLFISSSLAKAPIKADFFTRYPSAATTVLKTVPSNTDHCGVCHFNFNGGGPRNAYGAAVEAKRNLGKTNAQAFAELEPEDSDVDGHSNLVEITSALFSNTPTFPGLSTVNVGSISNVDPAHVTPHLTPTTGVDTTPPTVALSSPNGGQNYAAHSTQTIIWTASDASGIASVRIDASFDGGLTFETIAKNEANDGSFSWFVPNMPGAQNVIRVVAADNAGNYGSDRSNGPFSITQFGALTTLRDMKLPGSQPFAVAVEDPSLSCATCHGGYNAAVEPWSTWGGSMMAQAMRDPIFLACLAVAEQDAPSVGDLCLRCHTPGGWVEGRSTDTSGDMVNAKDRHGVQCDFCHRQVDPVYEPGVSPTQDVAVLDSLDATPYTMANGQFVLDPNTAKRGPFADALPSHGFLESPFHRSSDLCGTCHDVSNPVFVNDGAPGKYAVGPLNAAHPDGNLRNMFPVERTFSEWSQSEYATTGVYAPQFAGNKTGGIVSTCQDCHMQDVSGAGCNEPGAPVRSNLPLHDLTGGNTFMPDLVAAMFPGEVNLSQLAAGKQRATTMLQLAASMALAAGQDGPNPTLAVTVTNETAHKLPSGYPEGRRIWLNVKAWDAADNLVYESGAYDAATGVLSHDADAKIYEIKIGISNRLAPVLNMPAAPSFHFVLNDTVYSDNRIPPRGFTNAAFTTIQSPPVAHAYTDGQYWDETNYSFPTEARYAEVRLYYQTTSKEYVEFLRDANVTNSAGDDLYDLWVANGRGAPVLMAFDAINLVVNPTGAGDGPKVRTELLPNVPNPFNPSTSVRFALSKRQHVRIDVFDVSGAHVVTLLDEERPAGLQKIEWNGGDARDRYVSSGVYFIRMSTAEGKFVHKALLLK